MVTLNKEEEMVYATDFLSDSHSQNDVNQQKTDRKHVLLEKNGQEEALVTTIITPRVQGVIIVCDGGNDPIVIKKLTDAVTASLGIGANRVAVLSSVSNQ
jgi:stage III sporulation protein AG